MNRFRAFIALSAGLLIFPAGGLGQNHPETATLHLKVLAAANGMDLGVVKIEHFRSEETGKDFSAHFRGNSVDDIPYGTYRLKLRQVGFESAVRWVAVKQPVVWVVMGLTVGALGSPMSYPLSAMVRGLPSGTEDLWARLMGLYSGAVFDAKVSTSGEFVIDGIPQDHYVLVIRAGTLVLETRTVAIPLRAPLLIDLLRGPDTSPKQFLNPGPLSQGDGSAKRNDRAQASAQTNK